MSLITNQPPNLRWTLRERVAKKQLSINDEENGNDYSSLLAAKNWAGDSIKSKRALNLHLVNNCATNCGNALCKANVNIFNSGAYKSMLRFQSNCNVNYDNNVPCDSSCIQVALFQLLQNGSEKINHLQPQQKQLECNSNQLKHRDYDSLLQLTAKVDHQSNRSVSSFLECNHHRTKTKFNIFPFDNFARSCKHSTQSNQYSHTNVNMLNSSKSKSPPYSQLTIGWLLLLFLEITLIYITITSNSLNVAQASKSSNNYWPLTHQNRYQQLFFAGRSQSNIDNNNDDTTAARIVPATTGQQQHSQYRRILNPLRHTQQQAAAIAASAAAIAATADAALARKSQSHNLMIGQNFNNFSSIIPYSIMQDIDYGSMQEDQIVNEPTNDLQNQAILNNQHQANNNGESFSSYSDRELVAPMPAASTSVPLTADASSSPTMAKPIIQTKVTVSDRALLPLDSNRLVLPQMQQIKARFNQGCVGGTKCQFFAFCWMSGGSLGASCGLLMTCCVTPSRQEIQPGFYGPVVNDPYCGRSTSKINRIVGGTDASFGQFPWQAFVQVGGSRCGGALISSRHVVTAGHCVARSQHSPSSIKVTLGDYILNSDIESIPHEVYSVVEVLLHPNFRFTPQADRYDVAVLELDRAASYKDNIKPICLPQKDATFVGRVAYVAGWGALQAGSKLRPKVLQHVAVPVIENHVCESWHRRKGIDIRIYDEMMCAGYELGQRDACQGDSGGPLMLNQFGVWYLVGIVSAGYSCAKQYQPGIYHRVSSSSDWISSNVYQQGSSSHK